MKKRSYVQGANGCASLFWIFMAALPVLLAGCGAAEQKAGQRRGVDGYVYVAEEMRSSGWNVAENFYVTEEYFYYMSDSRTVKRTLLGDGDKVPDLSKGERVLALSGLPSGTNTYLASDSIADYAVDKEGNIYCVVAHAESVLKDGVLTTEYRGGTLYKQDPEGGEIYRLELSEAEGASYGSGCLALDGKGKAYILSGTDILVVDEKGKVAESLAVEPIDSFGSMRLLEGAGGQIFYYVAEFGAHIRRDAFLVNGTESLWLDAVPVLSERSGVELYNGQDGVLKSYGGRLYQYDGADLTELLKWGDSDIFEDDIEEVAQLGTDSYIVRTRPLGAASSQTLLLRKTAPADLPQKEEILLASLFPSDSLRQCIVEFNQSSDRYHISLESYGADFFGGDANEAAYIRLDSSLVSADPPDILDLADLEVGKYAENGMLEDLYLYMEGESFVNQDNYLGNVLDGYTINGKLVCIPTSFQFITWVGGVPEARTLIGWTMPEIMKVTEQYPDRKLFGAYYLDSADFLLGEFCASYYLEQFVDWDAGKCSFDSEEFRRLLEWVKVQEEKREWSSDSTWEACMIESCDIHDFDYYYDYLYYVYGEDAVLHGYPAADGAERYLAEAKGALGIFAGSKYKEGAWEFLKYYLSQESYGSSVFPTRLDLLEEEYQKAVGNVSRGYLMWDTNGNRVEKILKQEQADALMEILASIDFTPRSSAEEGIVKIVLEEMQYLMDGSKTADEVCHVIQNRAGLLLKERGRGK